MKHKALQQLSNIYEIVAYYYHSLKDIAIRETKKFTNNKGELDQDIFHSGLMKMVECLSDTPITLKQAKGYWCNLYKNALLRNCLYAREKYRDKNEFNEGLFESKAQDLDDSVDLQVMMSDIKQRFAEDYNIFIDYVDGCTLKTLDKKYGIKNADYRIRRIKKYVKETYPELGVGRKKKVKRR